MFRSALSINSRKAKETQHETISPPCAGRSRPLEFGWYLIKRVRRGSSVEMPAPICLTIPLYNSLLVSEKEELDRGEVEPRLGFGDRRLQVYRNHSTLLRSDT